MAARAPPRTTRFRIGARWELGPDAHAGTAHQPDRPGGAGAGLSVIARMEGVHRLDAAVLVALLIIGSLAGPQALLPRKRQSKHPPHDPQRSEAHHAAKSRCESLRYPAIAAILLPADIAGNTPARTDAIHPSRPYGSLDRQPVGQPPAMDRSRAMPRRAGPDRSWSSIPTHCRSCR